MQILNDGSVRLDPTDQITAGFLRKWKQDEKDPMVFRLKWPPCEKRELKVVTLPCGKKSTDYHCTQYHKAVSPTICEVCLEQ